MTCENVLDDMIYDDIYLNMQFILKILTHLHVHMHVCVGFSMLGNDATHIPVGVKASYGTYGKQN